MRRLDPHLLLAGGLGVAAVAGLVLGPGGGYARVTAGPTAQGAIALLANRWGPIFGVPPMFVMVIAKIESSFRPGAHNAAAVAQGGAWGAMQVTLATAKDIAAALRSSTSAAVKATLPKWDGTGESLLLADVGVMFGTYYLGKLVSEFGANLDLVAAAYHQGPGKVRSMLKASSPIPSALPPKGQQYVAMARAAYEALA